MQLLNLPVEILDLVFSHCTPPWNIHVKPVNNFEPTATTRFSMDNKLSSFAAVTGPAPTIINTKLVSRHFARACERGILRAFSGRLIFLNSDQDRRTEFLRSANVHAMLRQYASYVHTVVVSSESNNIYHQISPVLENLKIVEVRMPILRTWSLLLLHSTIGAYQDLGFVHGTDTRIIIDGILDHDELQKMVSSHAHSFSRPDHQDRSVKIFPVVCCRMLPVVMMPPQLSAQGHNANDLAFQGRFVRPPANIRVRCGLIEIIVPEAEKTG